MVMTSGWRGKGRVYISEPATTSLPSRVAPSAPYNSEHYAQTARHPSPANPAQLAHLAPQPSSPVAHNALHTATPPESGHKIAQTPHLNCGGPCTSASPHAPLHLRGQSSLLNPADLAYKPPPLPSHSELGMLKMKILCKMLISTDPDRRLGPRRLRRRPARAQRRSWRCPYCP